MHQVQEESQDPKALARKETKVLQESLVFLELWAQSDQKAYLEPLVIWDHQVIQVYKDSAESQEYPGRKVTVEVLDSQASKVNQETKVPEVFQVTLVYLECLDPLEKRDPKDQWVSLDMTV